MIRIYSIYDKVAGTLVGSLMTEKHHAPAIRGFYGGLADSRSMLSQHPGDYVLMCLGSVDDETGVITPEVDTVATGLGWLDLQKRDAASVES